MIRNNQYNIAHDNPILARVRQFYESKKTDPYIIFVQNQNDTSTEVVLFDAQNSVGVAGDNLPVGVSVNTLFNYTTGSNLTLGFSTATGTFNAGISASFAGKTASYDLAGKNLTEAATEFQTNPDFPISTVIKRDGASARLEFLFSSNDDSLTSLTVGPTTYALTRTDTVFSAFAGAGSSYNEFLQQIMVKPMVMEGNFIESTNILVLQTNDVIVEQSDVTGNAIKTFLTLNLDPYMRSSQRTMPTFNLLDGQTSLTITVGANSVTTLYLYALEEEEITEEFVNDVCPENMDEASIDEPIKAKPFDDYSLPKERFSPL